MLSWCSAVWEKVWLFKILLKVCNEKRQHNDHDSSYVGECLWSITQLRKNKIQNDTTVQL